MLEIELNLAARRRKEKAATCTVWTQSGSRRDHMLSGFSFYETDDNSQIHGALFSALQMGNTTTAYSNYKSPFWTTTSATVPITREGSPNACSVPGFPIPEERIPARSIHFSFV